MFEIIAGRLLFSQASVDLKIPVAVEPRPLTRIDQGRGPRIFDQGRTDDLALGSEIVAAKHVEIDAAGRGEMGGLLCDRCSGAVSVPLRQLDRIRGHVRPNAKVDALQRVTSRERVELAVERLEIGLDLLSVVAPRDLE